MARSGSVRVKIDTSDLMQKIPAFTNKVKKGVKEALIKTAQTDIETVAKQIIRANGHVVTGRLMASVHTEHWGHTGHSYSDNNGNSFSGGLSKKPSHELEVYVGTNVVYANYIHRMTPYLLSAFEGAKAKLLFNLKKAI